MKRLSIILVILIVCAFSIHATGQKDAIKGLYTTEKSNTMNVAALMGPSGIGMSSLIANPPLLGSTQASIEILGSVDVLLSKLINGDIDIGILPPNVAAKLYNSDPRSIVMGAIVGNSMLAIVTRDPSLAKISDLSGKTVYVAGQGATPEYVFRKLLALNGLSTDSTILDYSIPSTEIPAAIAAGKIAYALLPEPFATVAIINGKAGLHPVRRSILLKDLWSSVGYGDDFPMTLCVIRRDYADKNPEAVRLFLSAYRQSINWTVSHPDDAGKLVESSGIGLKAAIASESIPSCNLVFVDARSAKASLEKLLSSFLEYAPESIGGKLPNEDFYLK